MVRSVAYSRMAVAGCALLFIVLAGETAIACPNCRNALAGDPAHAGLARGFFWSILFMLSMPFLILGGLGSYFYWEVCRARRAAAVGGVPLSAEKAGSPFASDDSGDREETFASYGAESEEPVAVG